jgi:hypothetical protein
VTDTDLPDDLLDLERARVDARRALDEYVCTVEVQRRAEFPGGEQLVERRMWPAEANERHAQLQAAYRAAADAVRVHPLLVEAAAGRRLWAVEEKLRKEVPQVLVVVRRDAASKVERVVTILGGVDPEAKAA